MLSESDMSISEALSHFGKYNLDVCLLVPTATGMDKSIMDATEAVRNYLELKNYHDYASQLQGIESKVTSEAFFVSPNGTKKTQVSLYRPNTKNGDPRIWFYDLKTYANAYNLLAILVHDGTLYIVNCSSQSVMNSIGDPSSPLGNISYSSSSDTNDVAEELLSKLRRISTLGFVKTIRSGDTGIGMTLENKLGIVANTDRGPDYKGIEIKSKRLGKSRVPKNRVTLFSQVPDWKLSPIGSAWNLLSQYGYRGKGDKLRLSHQMDTVKPNSIGLMLQLDAQKGWLKQNHRAGDGSSLSHLTTWELSKLRKRLSEKHRETFWVSALNRGKGVEESFHYIEVQHTKSPAISNFDLLLEAGLISLDYTMSARDESKKTVRDHGYLFRIHPQDIPALFPQPATYNLNM